MGANIIVGLSMFCSHTGAAENKVGFKEDVVEWKFHEHRKTLINEPICIREADGSGKGDV